MQLFAEITSGDFPGERLVCCRNPVLAEERARKREDLLQATEKLLAPLTARVTAGRLHGAARIGLEAGKVINKYKTGKHFDIAITDTSMTVTRRQAQIDDAHDLALHEGPKPRVSGRERHEVALGSTLREQKCPTGKRAAESWTESGKN